MYAANVLVAGWISISSLFYPRLSQQSVFSDAFAYSEAFRLIGALWGAIFLLSILGLFFPFKMSLILFFQLVYKTLWLVCAALPAMWIGSDFPKGMSLFFLIWVLILPWIIPWKYLFLS